MDERKWQEMRELDEAAERAGGYVAFMPNPEQHVKYRELLKYCKEKGIEPLDLTIREYNRFVITEAG